MTLSYAVSQLQPGDALNVGAGRFGSVTSTPRNGTEANPIILQGQGEASEVGFIGCYHDYWHFKDLKFWNGTLNVGSESSSVNGGKQTGLRANHVLVEDCIFTTNSGYSKLSIGGNPPYYTGPVGTIVRGCTFENHGLPSGSLAYPAVGIGASQVTFENNTFQNSTQGGDAIHLFGRNNTIRNNRFLNWSYNGTDPGIHADLIQSYSTSNQLSYDHVIEKNFAYNCSKVQLGNVDNVGNHAGGTARISNWTWRNNIWIRVTNPLNLYAPNFKFYNETFYKCGTNLASPLILNFAAKGRADGVSVKNCIFYKCGNNTASGSLGWYSWSVSAGYSSPTGVSNNNNLVIGDGAGTTKDSSWNWFSSNGTSLNGVDPLFVDPINADSVDDVRLQSGSQAIGFGADLSANFTTDYEGTTRGVPFDLGALEQSGGSPPVDATAPTLTSAIINSTGLELTLVFTENVFHVSSAHYALTGGHSLGTANVVGPIVTMPISPAVQDGSAVTLSYTSGAGRTDDAAGNLLASFSITSGTPGFDNDSLETTPVPPRPGGVGPRRGKRIR